MASKASKKADAIALLKADHRKVEDLFEQYSKARSEDRKATLAKEICTELMIHAMIEEEIFYPALRGRAEDDMLDEALVEHDGAKFLIAELLAGRPGADFYDAKVMVLKEEIRHHVKEEEKPSEGTFAQARSAEVDLAGLGERLQARKEELMAQFKSDGPPTPTLRSFKGARVDYGQPVA
jgi:hypothetical protein